jgi:hypothetical protein
MSSLPSWLKRRTLSSWLEREAQRQSRRPELLGALISGRGLPYLRQRLGFVVLRLLLRTALHVLEVLFLSRALPFEYLAPLLTYRALASLAANLHWGASESLRERVRACVRVHKPALARASLETWLASGCRLAGLPVIFVVARTLASTPHYGISLFDAYALACSLRLLLDVFARTFHAGVFAVRRVYRPLTTLLCADLVEVALIVLGFDALGAWSIPLAIVLGGSLDAVLAIRYARAAYLRHRLLLPRWRRVLLAWPRPDGVVVRQALVHSLAGASLQLDAWLLLLLLRVDPPRAGVAGLSLLFYALRPLLGLATHWVRTFYFDLTRIDAGALRVFRPRLVRLLRKLALVCALLGAALTLGIARLVWPEIPALNLLWLVPFFVTRSLFALAQLQAFTRRRSRRLVWTSLSLAASLTLVAALARDGTVLLSAASFGLLVGFSVLRESSAERAPAGDGPVLGMAEWLQALRGTAQVRVGVLRVARSSAPAGRVMETLAAAHPQLRLARYARSHVLLMAASDNVPALEQLIANGAGALAGAWLSPVCLGKDSVGLARAQQALPAELHDALSPIPADKPVASLVAEFKRVFPAGSCLDLDAGSGALEGLPNDLLAEFLQQLHAASRQRDHDARGGLPFELAAYAPGGQASLVFVVARATPGFAAFRARVRRASLHASFYVDAAVRVIA